MPFDGYPHGGLEPIGPPKDWTNCRQGYGLELQRATGQSKCAYCGLDLTADFHAWLLMCVDHVVPQSVARELALDPNYCQDMFNLVLACSACNSFDNRYRVPPALLEDLPDDGVRRFVAIRDRVFEDRSRRIALRREQEMRFFHTRPWERSSAGAKDEK